MLPSDKPLHFTVRPKPFPGESTIGFVARVAAANGYASVRYLHTALRDRAQGAFDELCDRLKLSAGERALLFGVLPRHWNGPAIPLRIDIKECNQSFKRWCPQCLTTESALKGVWGLKLVCVCPLHETWLHDHCEHCGLTNPWRDLVSTYCQCGRLYKSATSEKADVNIIDLTRQLCEDRTHKAGLRVTQHLTSLELHRLVRYLGPFHSDPKPAHPGQTLDVHRLAVARCLVEGAAALLSNWPNNFNQLLSNVLAIAPQSPSVRRTFAPLYRVLYDELSQPCYQFLRDGFENYVQENWWGLICRRNKNLAAETVEDHPRLTLSQGANAAGIEKSVMHRLVQAELIPSYSADLPSGRKIHSLHAKDIEKIKSLTDGAMSLQQAASAIGLPEKRLRALIAHQLLVPLVSRAHHPSAASWLIPAGEVERFILRTTHTKASTNRLPIRNILKYWRLAEDEDIRFINAVVLGEIAIYGTQDKTPIGFAEVSTTDAKKWIAEFRQTLRTDFSVDQAAQLLGIKQQVAYDLVRLGLIKSEHVKKLGQRITKSHLEDFQAQYVSLAELAKKANCSPKAMLVSLEGSAVCGPSIDGTRQYFFRI